MPSLKGEASSSMRRERPIFVAWRKADSLRAFTLVELLVVIAIIGILAAMILPALSKSKASSQSVLCANHMHQLTVAALVYDSDNRRLPSMLEWMYPRGAAVPAPGGTVPPTMDLTKGLLYPYLQSKAVFVCPSETRSIFPWGPIDHSYQVQCNICHAHDATQCLAPARTVYFLEATNLSRGLTFALAPPVVFNMAFRHAKKEHLVFMDAHFEKKTLAECMGAASSDPRFWNPNTTIGMMGNP
jgi:prepilin-type N-terminal cleavage/methylation domain-containing protein